MKKEFSSQVNYKEMPYEATTWEIVNDYNPNKGFVPMTLDIITNEGSLAVDPVFADYGGIENIGDKRLHLPTNEAFDFKKYDDSKEQKNEEEDSKLVKLKIEELEEIQNEFFKKGFDEALNKANEEKEKIENELKEEVHIALEDLRGQINLYKKDLEKEALELSIKISEKILNNNIKENPEYILKIIHTALDSIKGASIKKIRVSEQSFEFLKTINKEEEFSNVEDSFEFVSDETINKGCIVESSLGDANFDLDSAFERIVNGIIK
ncbi:MAG: FliH/SctL family protein [Bdellovibrionota bacterium]